MFGEQTSSAAMTWEMAGAGMNLPCSLSPPAVFGQQFAVPTQQYTIQMLPWVELCPAPHIVPMERPRRDMPGEPVKLISNHFVVSFSNLQHIYQYNVTISTDSEQITNKTLLRRIMDKVKEVHGQTELDGKEFAYDGEKSMLTIEAIPRINTECTVFLEDASSISGARDNGRKKIRSNETAVLFKVEIIFASKISLKPLETVLGGGRCENYQNALRVLQMILRQHGARKNYLLWRQSFFHWSFAPSVDLGGGVEACKGYHVSFRPSQKGLSLNLDVSTTMFIKHTLIIDFLLENQNVDTPLKIDWLEASRVLKGVRIKAHHINMEFKVFGFSENICRFSLKVRNQNNQDNESSSRTIEVTVWNYFTNTKKMSLRHSADLPCVDVGRPKRPNYLPIEFCEILPGQRYTKSLSASQRSSLVKQSRQEPEERMHVLQEVMKANDYNSDPVLRVCNIDVDRRPTVIDGRVLDPPKLKFGKGWPEEEYPQRGSWNFNNKTLFQPAQVISWAVVNFTKCDKNNCERIADDFRKCCTKKGLIIGPVWQIFCENQRDMPASPVDRVESMLNQMKSKLSQNPDFLLCLLPERMTSDIYGPWKRKTLSEMGIVNQCIVPSRGMNDQYYTNVALKINAKVGGLNSVLSVEHNCSIPVISSQPTIIIGINTSNGSPGHDTSSIAAVVSSRGWPLISKYRASVRTQSRKLEMIEDLYKPTPSAQYGKTVDYGMIYELLIDFYRTCKPSNFGRKPQQMIIFRNGVSETQFDGVLNVELQAILKACNHLEDGYRPKVTLIIAQKNHHTKLFQANVSRNIQPGTIVDTEICHPRNFDFFLCPHNGPTRGISRPTHYHVLLDENKFHVDDLQVLVHALSYVYQRSTKAISVVAPIK